MAFHANRKRKGEDLSPFPFQSLRILRRTPRLRPNLFHHLSLYKQRGTPKGIERKREGINLWRICQKEKKGRKNRCNGNEIFCVFYLFLFLSEEERETQREGLIDGIQSR